MRNDVGSKLLPFFLYIMDRDWARASVMTSDLLLYFATAFSRVLGGGSLAVTTATRSLNYSRTVVDCTAQY